MTPERKPVLCYVTDRRAFEGALAPASEIAVPPILSLRTAIQNAASSGVHWIQIREKDLAAHALAELVRLAVGDVQGTDARILVNDRLDVALATNAAGIHLGENSLPLEAVAEWRRRSSRTDFQIGVSCHSVEGARAAELGGADYVFFGPVFATPSKAAFGPPQGIEKLSEVCASVGIPVLAIGGVNFENARACLEVGAAGFAAIRLFQGGIK